MITTYATFDPAQLGTGIASEMSGTVISVDTNNALNQYSRATLGKDELSWYAEFIVYGSASIANATSIGLVNASATGYVGSDANGWGYLLAEGEVRNNGANITGSSGVPVVAKGEVVSVSLEALNDSSGTMRAKWSVNGILQFVHDLPGGTYYLAVSLAVPSGNDTLRCFMNAGQRAFDYSSSLGWYEIPTDLPPIRIATQDYIADATASLPHAPFEAVIADKAKFRIARTIAFWPDSDRNTRAAAGKVKVINATQDYDWLLNSAFENLPATVKIVQDGTVTTLAEMRMTGAEGKSDSEIVFEFSDRIGELERPLQTALIHPDAVEANANRPWPIVLGAACSTETVLVDEINLVYALSDVAVIGLGYVRDKGDPWDPNAVPPDYTISADRRFMTVDSGSAPQGKVTADLSSVGGGTEPTSADDIWQSYGNPFTFDSSGDPVGWTEGGTPGSVTQNGSRVVLETSLVAPYIKQATNLIGGRAYRYHLEFNFASGFGYGQFGGNFGIYYDQNLGGGDDWHPLAFWSNRHPPYGDNDFGQTIVAEGTFIAPANVPVSLRFEANAQGYKVNIATATLLLIPDVYTPAAIDPIKLAPFAKAILQDRAKVNATDWDETSAQAIDTATGYTGIGFFAGDEITVRDAIDEAMSSYTACMFQGDDGKITFQRLTAPESETAVASVDMSDMLDQLTKTPDRAPGLSTRMGYRRNWTVLNDTDFVTDFIEVPRDVRRALSHKHQGIVASAVQLASMYRDAVQADPIGTLLDSKENAQTEIDRICTIYSQPRATYQVRIASPQFSIGDIVNVTYYRYGLETGRNLLVKQMVYDVIQDTAQVTFWGLA